ncbi:retrovirus-related pol polyprotein from transposon TNT 1-94 [Tanacetum coccineum]
MVSVRCLLLLKMPLESEELEGRIVGIKSLLDAVRITAAQVYVNTALMKLFNSIKDVKKLLEAVKKRFGGNAATKKTQRNLLKHKYENFTAPSSEMLDKTFDRLQKLVSYQPNSPQLVHEDLQQIHLDDIEDIDLRWQMAMLAMRARRFLKNTGRKLTVNGNETIGFDKSKVKCYNCHKRGHFARECRALRNQDNKNKEILRRSMHVETSTSTALVSYDGLGGYGWSDQAEEGPNYALMAFSSLSSDSEISNGFICSKSCLETVELLKSQNDQLLKDLKKSELMVLGYKKGLESVEEKLEVYKANKSIYLQDIKGLKFEIHVGEISIRELRKKLEKIVDNCKKGLGYENYNAVPPPCIGNFMPLTPDLSFTGLDEFVNKPVVENCKAMSSEEEPKVVRKNDDAPIIEEWVSDDEKEDVSQPKIEKKTVMSSIVKKEFVKSKQQEKTRNTVTIQVLCNIGKTTHIGISTNGFTRSKVVIDSVLGKRNNMYSVDLKNIVPKGGLTCLFAKATSDESKLWHRRLGIKQPQSLFVTDDYSRFTWVFFLATKDETSGILKSFITEIENLVDHKVKVIRYDNGTEFKNREMNQFCKMKGILRQFSVDRTPQQNGVAERRNRTLIEAVRTMLANSKLPTTFWAEAVNTTCYAKCDGKADVGVFVGYSLYSKSFRVFNSRTRIVEENLHIRFSDSTPNVVGSGPDWLFDIDALTRTMNYKPIVAGTQSNGFAGTKASDNAGQARKETEPVKDYILLPLWTADPPFSQNPKSSHDDGSKPSSDDGKKVDEDPRKESECND